MKDLSLKSALSQIFFAGSVGIGVLATACCAQTAYETRTLVADIPFSFTSGSEIMPAGRYKIVELPQHLVVLRSEDLKHVRYMSAGRVQASKAAERGKLIFHRYGDQYFLFQLWSAGSADGVQVQRGHAEQEMLRAANNPKPSSAEVASSGAPQH